MCSSRLISPLSRKSESIISSSKPILCHHPVPKPKPRPFRSCTPFPRNPKLDWLAEWRGRTRLGIAYLVYRNNMMAAWGQSVWYYSQLRRRTERPRAPYGVWEHLKLCSISVRYYTRYYSFSIDVLRVKTRLEWIFLPDSVQPLCRDQVDSMVKSNNSKWTLFFKMALLVCSIARSRWSWLLREKLAFATKYLWTNSSDWCMLLFADSDILLIPPCTYPLTLGLGTIIFRFLICIILANDIFLNASLFAVLSSYEAVTPRVLSVAPEKVGENPFISL